MTKLNLDQKAAKYAQWMVAAGTTTKKDAKAVENLITKTLGVLQEQGVYACVLFLFSRTGDEDKIAQKIRPYFYQSDPNLTADSLLGELPGFNNKNDDRKRLPAGNAPAEEVLKFYADEVCDDLDTLFLVKDLYEQTLIYARYGAKAAKTDKDRRKQKEGT